MSVQRRDIIEKLEDLLKQATTERSHYYVASVCTEAMNEINALAREVEALKAELAIDADRRDRIHELATMALKLIVREEI